jgi:hypothetical protein
MEPGTHVWPVWGGRWHWTARRLIGRQMFVASGTAESRGMAITEANRAVRTMILTKACAATTSAGASTAGAAPPAPAVRLQEAM